jgi:hypothetical protein
MAEDSVQSTWTGGVAAAKPTALTVAQLARLLGLAEEKVYGHLADGAPAGGDGTVNLVHYVAWVCLMLRKESRKDSEADTPC